MRARLMGADEQHQQGDYRGNETHGLFLLVQADEVLAALSGSGIGRSLAKQAIEMAQQQGRLTVFAVVDALTRLSRRIEYAGDRTELDQQAGKLLTLAA